MSYNDYQAPKYDPKLTREQIKARILADLKAAVASGDLPACKPTLREGRGGHTLSLTVTLRDFAGPVLNAAHVRCSFGGDCDCRFAVGPRSDVAYSIEARRALDTANEIAGAYNFDKSDIQADYFHVGYYLHVGFDSAQVERERGTIIAGASAKRASIVSELRGLAMPARDAALESGDRRGVDIANLCAKPTTFEYRDYLARVIDAVHPVGAKAFVARAEVELKAAEDWSTADGETAQRALYASAPIIGIPPGGGTPPTPGAVVLTTETATNDKRRAAALKAVATRRANALKAVAS